MRRSVLVYAIVIAASVAAIAGLIRLGEVWFASSDPQSVITEVATAEAPLSSAENLHRPLAILIIQLMVIVLAAQVFGSFASLVKQPSVVGEIAAGLLLGPSLLGHVWPVAYTFLFPTASLDILRLISQVGVILFMFTVGLVMPPSPGLRHQLRERLESLSSVFLLPVFFAYTGLRTQIGLLNDFSSWAVCLGIILTAIAGKLIGSMLAARWTGSSWHDAFVLGALMNTRGLMELIALNVGYDLGILSPRMFTMLVVMALVTTAMTGPLIDLMSRERAVVPERTGR